MCRLWGRVVLSLGLLVSSKLITIQVPFFFKSIVDQLNISQQVGGHGHDGDSPSSPCLLLRPYSRYPPVPRPCNLCMLDIQALEMDPTATVPLALLLGYGIARTTAAAFQELRNSVFATVAQKAIRKVGRAGRV